MNRILIFSGTTEGRMLAQTLSENGIHCIVSVATEYGESVMPEMEGVTVHKGRMDLEKMQKFIAQSEVAVVVDATHPFATAVSENIRESLKNTEIPYIRLQRETSDITLNKDTIQENHSDVILCSDATECADFLSSTDGNILLTTGSKELAAYSRKEALKDRLFVRVLPGLESISLCEKNGICGKQIIAMQGPFSLEMNRALIRQFDIKYLVTKESGRTGGFLEKIKAAEAEGITACVIGNPEKQNSGDTFTQVCRKISKITGKTIKNQIALIGTGMGNEQTLTIEAAEKIREADYIFGAERLLRIIKNEQAVCYPYYLAADIIPELDRLSGCGVKVVILFSGDTGFYSGCGKLYETLKGRSDSSVRIYPGISSVSYFAALTGYSYQDAAVLSIHGHGAETFLQKLPHFYYEENALHAFLLESVRDYGTALAATERFLPYVDNWAVCDCFSPKVFAQHKPELLPAIRRWLGSDRTYTVRYGIGMLMRYYLDDDFRSEYLAWVAAVHSEEYYVNMMRAWYFATALAKQPTAALPWLTEKRLDVWTHNKTIQKAVESYRIPPEQKQALRALRIRSQKLCEERCV